ncbi:SDR family NAD(P)-dependent oxidoreductase [Streptomyces sp. NBC_01549]|uniref:SDR family NAD(P)-dependent oxidoreductase n=1 Tax=Streptomyces sp. NBC_01549 TaxID=2975874 RepID=UPI002254ACA7|nr:SDR family NAD(P)-dependent oxidoreductase [Streptomyces sp. NBC_01549]MCX4592938.1 SDR family NAD(P)-dependent oxidoreductase [Streptomyces sp. NBC_01549]
MELGAGQVAVVTGAASGIGLAMARRFAADGLKVVLADVEEGALEKAASALREDGAEVYARVVDVSEREQLDALAAETYEKYGAVHVLCNNAGVGSGAEGRMCAYATARTPRCPWRPWSPPAKQKPRKTPYRSVSDWLSDPLGCTGSGCGGNPREANRLRALVPTAKAVSPRGTSLRTLAGQARTALTGEGARRRLGAGRARHTLPQRNYGWLIRLVSLDQWEAAMKEAGQEVRFTPVEEVADLVADGIREDRFWLLPASEHSDRQIRARSRSMLDRADPSYLEHFILD